MPEDSDMATPSMERGDRTFTNEIDAESVSCE